jgi:D-alanine-D-alanine ligase
MKKTIVILHHPVLEDAGPDDQDVLVQAAAVADALESFGYGTSIVPFDLDLARFAPRLAQLEPLCVFNLVESFNGDGRLIHLACSILDHLGIPYTGAGVEAMFITSNKVLAKRWMLLAGIPTSEWIVPGKTIERDLPFPSKYIIKTLWEEGSIGIDKESVVDAENLSELLDRLEKRSHKLGKQCFAEHYIDGREFNLALLAKKDGVEVLPPAEIKFEFPDDQPKIIDYRAKWIEDSVEYQGTTRSLDFPPEDEPLLEKIKLLGLKCWENFNLRGYARLDLRVDEERNPWVLEVNTNPCISPDGGFSAASAKAGISYSEIIKRILFDTLKSLII